VDQNIGKRGAASQDVRNDGERRERRVNVTARSWVAWSVLLPALAGACNTSTDELAEKLKAKLTEKATSVLREKLAPGTPDADDRNDPAPVLTAALYAYQPSFETVTEGTFGAGKMVVVKTPGAPDGLLALSCIHIFGPDGGLSREIPSSDLPTFIKQTKLIDVDAKGVEIGAPIPLAGARRFTFAGGGLPDASTDISVFRVPAASPRTPSSSRAITPRWVIASGCWRGSSAARRPTCCSTRRTYGSRTSASSSTSSRTTSWT
jgi:hypothetical protein